MVRFSHPPVSFALRDDPIPDSCPLTSWEKVRKEELEQVVQGGLAKFLEVGMAKSKMKEVSFRLPRKLYADAQNAMVYTVPGGMTKISLRRIMIDALREIIRTAKPMVDRAAAEDRRLGIPEW